MTTIALTIGGSDSWGGGGIQTDLKTFDQLHTFGLSVLTSIAVESVQKFAIRSLESTLVQEQLQTIENTVQIQGVKIGLLGSTENLDVVTDFCHRNIGRFPFVIDPVLAFKETEETLQKSYLDHLRPLLSMATVITPNLREAEMISGKQIRNVADMQRVAHQLFDTLNVPVLLKGGTRLTESQALDYFTNGALSQPFIGPCSENKTVHGAGCCLSSAICAYLCQGLSLVESIKNSQQVVFNAIETGLPIQDAGNVWYQPIIKE